MSSSADAGTETETETETNAETETPSVPAESPLGWDDFPSREVPGSAEGFVSPEGELTSLAQRSAEDLRLARAEGARAAEEIREVLFDLAVLTGRLDQLVPRAEREPLEAKAQRQLFAQLRVVRNQMLQTMTNHGIDVRDPTGRSAAEVMDWVEVGTWLHRAEFEAEVVAQTQECAIFHDGRPVRLARVDMGAPVEPDKNENEKDGKGEQGS